MLLLIYPCSVNGFCLEKVETGDLGEFPKYVKKWRVVSTPNVQSFKIEKSKPAKRSQTQLNKIHLHSKKEKPWTSTQPPLRNFKYEYTFMSFFFQWYNCLWFFRVFVSNFCIFESRWFGSLGWSRAVFHSADDDRKFKTKSIYNFFSFFI